MEKNEKKSITTAGQSISHKFLILQIYTVHKYVTEWTVNLTVNASRKNKST